MRFPGGSESDGFNWLQNELGTGSYGAANLSNFIHLATNVNAQTMITVNYGSGTSNEAGAWVAYVNATPQSSFPLGTDANGINWHTAGYWASLRAAAPLATDDGSNVLRLSRTAPLNFKYWEIGNEEYGSWETDTNSPAHDPYTYAALAKNYMQVMRSISPTIKIGVMVTPGEDSYVNNHNHPATNSVTGQVHYGWTPVLLSTLKNLNVVPDFLIHHRYPENPGSESDAGLLASSTGWASDAANLRGQVTDYMGSSLGAGIELLCTENNSVSSAPGRQSVSLVNALFKMDSLAQLMQTEFNGLFWWDLWNGPETDGNLGTNLYGWRNYGDYGVMFPQTGIYPTYYTSVLMTNFVQAGDTVVNASSEWSLLSIYAVHRLDGSLTLLTINKDPTNTLTGQISVTGFTSATNATVYSYGIPQDNAVRYGEGSPNIAQTSISFSGTTITYAFPPYSSTVMVLTPPPTTLLPLSHSASQVVLQLQGEAGIAYVLESSTNLTNWTPVSTNTPVGNTINLTNSVSSVSQKYWRAKWQP